MDCVKLRAYSVLLSSTLVACGGTTSPEEEDGALLDEITDGVEFVDCAEAAQPADGEYPPGPYGGSNPPACEILGNMGLRGFFNATGEEPSASLSIDDHTLQTLRDTGATYLMVHTSATWCPSCRDSAFALGGSLRPDVDELREQGGIVLEMVVEASSGGTVGPPSDAELLSWAQAYDLNVSVMVPDAAGLDVFRSREYAYVIELPTMQVVWNSGFLLYRDPSAAGIAALKALLQDE